MKKNTREIKHYELPDYKSFSEKYPNVLKNENEFKEFKIVYESMDLTSAKFIKKFYKEYWEENSGKVPGVETPKLYQVFLIKEAINLFRKIK
ncbi:MAG: hypothetical protein PQ612_09590 [Rickettsiales bacterium]|nr:hypothetical protein [Pseudomonadota bacterium]MDA0966045.1 hypothetical protein [Pseudomonadota bacterium]MDG4544227.1 hypothetical protein [Rickettsiales bacterium]MDG4546407.1 hypothetical protein [Rickettsiales bacterium]MDG4548551.1 hypothetical protein [Rickettsiales bacterium]